MNTLLSRRIETFPSKKYSTAYLYIQKLCVIRLNLRRWLCWGNIVIESIVKAMILNLSFISIGNARRKFECVSFYFEFLCEENTKFQCERIRLIWKNLVNEYEMVLNKPFFHLMVIVELSFLLNWIWRIFSLLSCKWKISLLIVLCFILLV